jgi:predicted RND superfamily exporter protein
MIEDYQAEQQQPLIVGDKAFKYHPIDSVDLEKPNLKPILSDEELEDLSDEYASLIDEYTRTTNEIANLRNDLKVEDENINDRMARAKTRIQKTKIEQDYLIEASRIKKEIDFQLRYLAGIEADLESAQVRLNQNTDNVKNNEDEIVRSK